MKRIKGAWCHSISPVFFGRSVRGRHLSKAEAARRRQEGAKAEPPADEAAGPDAAASSVATASVAGNTGTVDV